MLSPENELNQTNLASVTADTPADGRRPTSERRVAASQANGRKSRGPVTEEGKQRSSQNASKRAVRLLGLAEARTLNQEPGAAAALYRELIAPYEPAPELLAMHFQDLARLHLELEAWERIRDARLEDRWQQNDLERRRRFHDMDRDLEGTLKEVFQKGVCRLEDSPAKFKRLTEGLGLLRSKLANRDPELGPLLHNLYGETLDPTSARAQTICIRCEPLLNPKAEPLSDDELQALPQLVDAEEHDALTRYGLQLDASTMSRSACLAGLGPSREDQWMNRQGERLRQAIDRNKRLIPRLLKMLGLADGGRPTKRRAARKIGAPKFRRNEPEKPSRINKSARKRT